MNEVKDVKLEEKDKVMEEVPEMEKAENPDAKQENMIEEILDILQNQVVPLIPRVEALEKFMNKGEEKGKEDEELPIEKEEVIEEEKKDEELPIMKEEEKEDEKEEVDTEVKKSLKKVDEMYEIVKSLQTKLEKIGKPEKFAVVPVDTEVLNVTKSASGQDINVMSDEEATKLFEQKLRQKRRN